MFVATKLVNQRVSSRNQAQPPQPHTKAATFELKSDEFKNALAASKSGLVVNDKEKRSGVLGTFQSSLTRQSSDQGLIKDR